MIKSPPPYGSGRAREGVGALDTSMRHRAATLSAMVRRWHGGVAVGGGGLTKRSRGPGARVPASRRFQPPIRTPFKI
jgi:hypothetical protein